MSNAVASLLSPEETAEIERQLGLGVGPSNLPNGPTDTLPTKKILVTLDEVREMRPLGIPLDGYFVRMTDGHVTGTVQAAMIDKWLGMGFTEKT